jgi:hypothetical protein
MSKNDKRIQKKMKKAEKLASQVGARINERTNKATGEVKARIRAARPMLSRAVNKVSGFIKAHPVASAGVGLGVAALTARRAFKG